MFLLNSQITVLGRIKVGMVVYSLIYIRIKLLNCTEVLSSMRLVLVLQSLHHTWLIRFIWICDAGFPLGFSMWEAVTGLCSNPRGRGIGGGSGDELGGIVAQEIVLNILMSIMKWILTKNLIKMPCYVFRKTYICCYNVV